MANKPSTPNDLSIENSWQKLRAFTDARIGLGRAGSAIPTQRLLEFQMDHANARDAVHIPLDLGKLCASLPPEYPHLVLESKAGDRATYLQRPDYGRQLSDRSVSRLNSYRDAEHKTFKACIVIADGLSSTAVQAHAGAMTAKLCQLMAEKDYSLAPVCVVQQGRVAIGDEIGEILGVDLLIMMIGERPGLSSPDSLGIYYTYNPVSGLQDSSRNCISNIRPAGLTFQEAADKLMWLIEASIKLQKSGVMLKDESEPINAVTGDAGTVFLTAPPF